MEVVHTTCLTSLVEKTRMRRVRGVTRSKGELFISVGKVEPVCGV